jgi:hypothetical protein
MRRSFALLLLFGIGCGTESAPDTNAAQEFVRRVNRFAEPDLVEDPEYADIPNIPMKGEGTWDPAKPAACGVRVKFHWRDEKRTTHDDWVVWVTSDHKAIGWTDRAGGDNWRAFVQSFAKP